VKGKFKLQSLYQMLSEIEESNKIVLGIDLVDNLVGGIIPGQLHAIVGDSGSGKTWLCLKTIQSILKYNSSAKIGYVDFSANIRSHNLHLMISEKKYFDQIDFFQPETLIESLIFTKSLLNKTHYDLLIFDTLFGSPLQILETLSTGDRNWASKIFLFLLNLRKIAKESNMPILVTHSLFNNNSFSDKEFAQVEPFISLKFLLHRAEDARLVDIYFFQQFLGSEKIQLYSLE
jgi:predicted ATP-dependent serine protease